MRMKGILAAAVALAGMGLASPNDARAFDRDRADVPRGWVDVRPVRHWVYYPRYRNYYYTNGQTDPFAYAYEPRGYYPYYNSGEWKPLKKVAHHRAHYKHPAYFAGWGSNRRHWDQYTWHLAHDGRGAWDR